jgi:hypothetical protein
MTHHPFPAEHDQQQAEALDILKGASAFILVHFPEEETTCENPFCVLMHQHRTTRIIASCSHRDLHHAVEAIGEEIVLTSAIDLLMNLSLPQREQIAALLREEKGAFFHLADDEG